MLLILNFPKNGNKNSKKNCTIIKVSVLTENSLFFNHLNLQCLQDKLITSKHKNNANNQCLRSI